MRRLMLNGEEVPAYPSWGFGGGSQMEMRAQDAWEAKYGPPPGEPGARVQVMEDGYPAGWPKCPACGSPALDGHITCGRVECGEASHR